MPIIGLNLKAIKASMNEAKVGKNININSSPLIEKIEKKDLKVPGVGEVLSIQFKFTTNYESETNGKKIEKIGEMVFEGAVIFNSEDNDKILKSWEKEKKLDELIAIEVLNAIFKRCLIKGIDIASEIGLPPPIKLPTVKPKEQSEYIG